MAGWTGRDRAAMERHIVEMEAIGVKRPSSLPVFYRCSASRLNTADEIEVTGEDSSGEVEFVLIQSEGNLWVGTGSDQTDRKVESYNITVSKRAVPGGGGIQHVVACRPDPAVHGLGCTARRLRHVQRHHTGHRWTAPVAAVRVRIRGSGVRPVSTARVHDPDAAGHWLNQINKARRVLNAGPEEGQDEEKETKRTDYSDGTAKFPMKELRLSGLLQVEPRPCPVNVWAMA